MPALRAARFGGRFVAQQPVDAGAVVAAADQLAVVVQGEAVTARADQPDLVDGCRAHHQ